MLDKLIEKFDLSIKEELVPFMENHGLRHDWGNANYEGKIPTLKRVGYSELSGSFFSWVNRFENNQVVIDVRYGDREFIIETKIFCIGQQKWFSAWELLNAADIKNIYVASGEQFVLSCQFMEKTIKNLSNGIIENWEILYSCDKALIEKAILLRSERIKSYQEEQEAKDMKSACIHASEAFHANKYRESIRLLEPYEKHKKFPKVSSKLLAIARKNG